MGRGNTATWDQENRNLDARLVSAIGSKDVEGVMSCFTNSPDLIAVLWGTEMHGPAELRQAIESMFNQCDALQLTIDRVSRVCCGDTVFAVGQATYVIVRAGVSNTIREVWTDVRRKVDGKWSYVLDHAEVLPGT
jgi:ketosteroid isomerase-like protein